MGHHQHTDCEEKESLASLDSSCKNFMDQPYEDSGSDSEEECSMDKCDKCHKEYTPFQLRRKRIRRFLHSREFHISSIALVILDCIIVLTEIILDLYLKEEDEHLPHHSEEKPHKITVHEVLPYVSLALLSVFVIERFVKVTVDSHHFFTHKMEIFDFVVVIGSFTVDVAVLAVADNDAFSAIGLIVILRLWRVVRIANGIIVGVKKTADKRVHAVKEINKELENKLERLAAQIEFKNKEIEYLRRLLDDNGVKVEQNFVTCEVIIEEQKDRKQ